MGDKSEGFFYLIVSIIGICVFVFHFWGIYYGFYRHGVADGVVTVFVPPYAWYRGASFFWEEPKWKANYYKYTQNIAILLEISYKSNDIRRDDKLKDMEINTERWIDKLPKDKKQYIRNTANSYASAMINYNNNLYEQSKFGFNKNPLETKSVQKHLKNFNKVKGFSKIWNKYKAQRENVYRLMKDKIRNLDISNKVKFRNRIKRSEKINFLLNTTKKNLKQEIKTLFDDV